MNRILIVDAQLFHTPAWHRGMGKYSTELIAAMDLLNTSNKRWDSVEILLSSRLPLEEEVIDVIRNKIENPKFVYLDLARDEITNAQAIMGHNRKSLDEHIAELSERHGELEIDFLILSPMQGGICSVFPTDIRVRKATVFYDLIPMMFHEVYFRNKIAEMEFSTKLTELLKADVYFAISKTVANDLSVHLGVDPSRIKSIDGGPIEHATGIKNVNVNKPFILMPTGNDLRKNNRGGIQGFNEFNQKHHNAYTLVITSNFDPDQIAELSKMAEKVVFTGNISGEELNYLFEECEALLFPSEYEGLGLPVLEAAEKNKPVACSDITVFREISEDAFHFFDPFLSTSIAAAIEQAVDTPVNKKKYTQLLKKYTWDASAKAALRAFEDIKLEQGTVTKQRITVFAPNPEARSTTSRTVQRLHAELSRRYNPSYIIEGIYANGTPRPNFLPFVTDTLNVSKDVPIAINDQSVMNLYHIDGGRDSAKSVFAALAKPGILILYSLDATSAWESLLDDRIIPEDRYVLERSFDKKIKTKSAKMLYSLVSRQQAIVVFSEDAKKVVVSLLASSKSKADVYVARYPVSSLVYTELTPLKKRVIGAINVSASSHAFAILKEFDTPFFEKLYIADDAKTSLSVQQSGVPFIKVANDRYFESNIGRLDLVIGADTESDIEALESSRYGVIPIRIEATKNTHLISLPKEAIKVDGIGGLLRAADALSLNNSNTFAKLQEEIRFHNSYRSFVDLLTTILSKRDGD